MTLNNAIARNRELRAELVREGRLEKAKSVQLGIEALKRVQFSRKDPNRPSEPLLPGETEY